MEREMEMERGTIRPVDYLIVDECQDFSKEEIAELKICGNICFFFGDSAQSIMYFPKAFIPHITQTVEETAKVLGAKEETLFYNYRLTKQTAALAEKVRGQDGLVEQCVRKGQKPYLVNAQSFDKQLDKIANMINNGLNNVGILLPYNRIGTAKKVVGRTGNPWINVEYVKDYLFSKGITCEFKYDDAMDLDFHTDNPKIMTWWCAKGIQFKNIFIPGCESYFFNDHRNAFYVAITRSCERLFLGYSGSLNQFLPDTSSELYDNPSVRKTGNVPLTYQEMGGAIVEVVPNTF